MKTTEKIFDVISVGDTTTDVFMQIEDAEVFCENRKKDCLICFNYADKVAASGVTEIDAVGNAANNAVGSSRLGLKTGIWTILGDDMNGHQAFDAFHNEKVITDFIETDKTKDTNYSVVINFHAERTILVYHNERHYIFPELPIAKWIYLTSMGHGWETISEGLMAYLKKTGAKLAFNPGTHQINSGLKKLKPFLSYADFFILNIEEAQKILGVKDGVKILLQKMAKLGPKAVVITDGGNGSYAIENNQMWQVPIIPDFGPVVERTGCGDGYATATVAALCYGEPIQEALRWGSANARMVVQFIGAQKGLQTKAQIKKTLAEFADILPKKI